MNEQSLVNISRSITIEQIELFPLRYPTVMRFRFFEGPISGGGRPAVLIKITASDGSVGWGESVPVPRWSYETLESAVSTLENYLIPILQGMNPFDLEFIHQVMNKEIANGFSTGAPITKAGIDIALHDLIGRSTGLNIAEFWGRTTPDDLTLSWTLNPVTLDDVAPLIVEGKKRGYEHFNIKISPDPNFDLELCRLVKAAVPEGFLWADANGGFEPPEAIDIAPRIAEAGAVVFEQPVPINRISAYQEIRRISPIPIIIDEGVVTPTDLLEFIKLGMCDGMAMKPARCGGLQSAARQLQILQDSGMMFLGSGLTDPDISLAASLILYGAFDLKYPAALNGPQFLGESVLKEPFSVVDGKIQIPKGPGLGIEVDEDKVLNLMERSKT